MGLYLFSALQAMLLSKEMLACHIYGWSRCPLPHQGINQYEDTVEAAEKYIASAVVPSHGGGMGRFRHGRFNIAPGPISQCTPL